MKIRDRAGGPAGLGPTGGARPVSKVGKVAKNAAAASVDAASSASSSAPVDQATFLGLSEAELSPNVRAALTALLDEVRHLRDELDRTRKRISHLERVADEDAMLPIANRRAFVRELTRLISFSERYGSPGSVLYFDLNGMKQINDRFGHAAGDSVLRTVVALIADRVRRLDRLFRIGGDEFLLLLPDTNGAAARALAEELRGLIAGTVIPGASSVTVSIGLAVLAPGQQMDAWMHEADAALYAAKQQGRDRVMGAAAVSAPTAD